MIEFECVVISEFYISIICADDNDCDLNMRKGSHEIITTGNTVIMCLSLCKAMISDVIGIISNGQILNMDKIEACDRDNVKLSRWILRNENMYRFVRFNVALHMPNEKQIIVTDTSITIGNQYIELDTLSHFDTSMWEGEEKDSFYTINYSSYGSRPLNLFNNETVNGKSISKIYWYEDNDMLKILESRLQQHENKTKEGQPVYVLGPLDNMDRDGFRRALTSHGQRTGIILIPFNLGQLHWVGLLLVYDLKQNLTKANYYDPEGGDVPELLNATLQSLIRETDIITQFYPIKDIDGLIRQINGHDCGPCTLENLLYAIGYGESPDTDPIQRRLNHLDLLEVENPDYYKSFYERQRLNQSSFVNSPVESKKCTP